MAGLDGESVVVDAWEWMKRFRGAVKEDESVKKLKVSVKMT